RRPLQPACEIRRFRLVPWGDFTCGTAEARSYFPKDRIPEEVAHFDEHFGLIGHEFRRRFADRPIRLGGVVIVHKEVATSNQPWVKEPEHVEGSLIDVDIQHDEGKFFILKTSRGVGKITHSKVEVVIAVDVLRNGCLRGFIETRVRTVFDIFLWKTFKGIKEEVAPI